MTNAEITKGAWAIAREMAETNGKGSKENFKEAIQIMKVRALDMSTPAPKKVRAQKATTAGATLTGTRPASKTILAKVEVLFRSAQKNYSRWGQWLIETTTREEAIAYVQQHGVVKPLVRAAKAKREQEVAVQNEAF